MNKYQAIHSFWSGFGIPAYDQSTVPESAELPYITYDVYEGGYDETVPLSASIWWKSKSWSEITAKLTEVSEKIGTGIYAVYDGGAILIVKGLPFAQRVTDEDDSVRRILINVNAEFIGE